MRSVDIAEGRTGFTSEQRELVLGTLRAIVESSHFSRSKRYPAFLEYIVLAAIEEPADSLKERTVGIDVFGRAADYDTSSDPVVRIAAGEVRRRMALYFSEHPELPVRIDIPAGSYRAEFHFRPNGGSSSPAAVPTPVLVPSVPLEVDTDIPDSGSVSSPPARPGRTAYWRRPVFRIAIAALLLVLIAGSAWWRYERQAQERNDFWRPVFRSDQPAMVVIGQSTFPASAGINWANLPLDDAIVTAQICSVIREYKRDCTVKPGLSATTDDLRGKSVVVIGGFNNPWSSRLLSSLPYQLQAAKVSPDDLKGHPSVVEHQSTGLAVLGSIAHPQDTTVDRDKDYAVIARFHSDITESVAVVIAGLNLPGTTSAGQYVSTPEKMREILARAPKGWAGVNFEAVLQVDLIQGNAGRVEVIATRFW